MTGLVLGTFKGKRGQALGAAVKCCLGHLYFVFEYLGLSPGSTSVSTFLLVCPFGGTIYWLK